MERKVLMAHSLAQAMTLVTFICTVVGLNLNYDREYSGVLFVLGPSIRVPG